MVSLHGPYDAKSATKSRFSCAYYGGKSVIMHKTWEQERYLQCRTHRSLFPDRVCMYASGTMAIMARFNTRFVGTRALDIYGT